MACTIELSPDTHQSWRCYDKHRKLQKDCLHASDKWYIHTNMATDEYNNNLVPDAEPQDSEEQEEKPVPIGIARIREEWRAAGLVQKPVQPKIEQVEPVVFPEVEGGAGIGDYTLDCETVRDNLGLSQEAIDRLIDSGELDSILVQGSDGVSRRLISESSVKRFEEDSAIDPDALKRAAKAMADQSVVQALEELQSQIDELKNTQAKVLQQMKDILLLEVRNLKEQDRDLTSFVYELAQEIRAALPRKKR